MNKLPKPQRGREYGFDKTTIFLSVLAGMVFVLALIVGFHK